MYTVLLFCEGHDIYIDALFFVIYDEEKETKVRLPSSALRNELKNEGHHGMIQKRNRFRIYLMLFSKVHCL